MRIGIDVRLWAQTGVGRYIRNLVLELSKIDRKNDYFLFARTQDESDIKSFVSNPKFKVIPSDVSWHSFKEQLLFPKIITGQDLDIMHFTYFSIPVFYTQPYILTVHDLTLNHFKSGKASTRNFALYNLKRQAYIYVLNTATKKAKKIIAVSESTKHELVDHMNISEDKIAVVYEGVDSQILSGSKNKASDPYLLYVGNVYPHKNVEMMILAFFKAQKPGNARLILVGRQDFFYKKLKKKIERIDRKKQVIFKGFVTDRELSSLYKNARGLVMPSLMEGFGLPVLEAMANKCLVLASNIPALSEIAGDAAIYFDPNSINDISEKIEFAFSEKDKTERLENGLTRSKKFSWDKMAEETLRIYEDSISLRQSK